MTDGQETNVFTLTNTKYENWAEIFFLQSAWQMLKLLSSAVEDSRKWAFVRGW